MSNIAQVCEFWAGKIPVKIINFHSLTPDAQAYNQLRRTQRKPFQLTWIYIWISYCHVLPYVAYASFNDLQGALVSFKASMKGGAAQATGPAEFPKAFQIWPSGHCEEVGNMKKRRWKFGTCLFFVIFFAHVFSTAPVPADLILSRSTRELYKRLF